MGADRGVIVAMDTPNDVDTLALSRVIADQFRSLSFDVILTGQYSDDFATGQVGPQVAELLGIPQVGSVTGVEAQGDVMVIGRDTEDGRQTIEVRPPVVLLTQAGLNEPRLPSLKGIMGAKKKPVEHVTRQAEDSTGRISWGAPFAPERASVGTIVQDVPAAEAARQLTAWLRERKLI
jgi:electron transfer flavoprotein beta subunit